MNRSYSKIRHIQESNQKLEERMVSEYGYYRGMDKDREGWNWVTEDWGAGGRGVMRMR